MVVQRARRALVAVMALSALLLSLAAMHAAMGSASEQADHVHVASMSMAPAPADSQLGAATNSRTLLGGMSPTDCLLFGMVCFLMAVALLLLPVVFARLRSLLRSRDTQRLLQVQGRLRPPRPPSLLLLSISRI